MRRAGVPRVNGVRGSCRLPDCDQPTHARDLCLLHYRRVQRTGSPHRTWSRATPVPRPRPTAVERFAAKVVEADTGCLLWTGYVAANGYGRVQVEGRSHPAHRWAWEQVHGPLPAGMVMDHLCRVRHCVRVDHLEAVTQRENVRRGRRGVLRGH